MDKPVEFYVLTKTVIQPPKPGEFAIASAALMNCKLCGICIDGMGGPGQSICIKCGDELKAGKHAARGRVRLHAAAKCAAEHLERMAKWISARGEGYSFEALGEDISEIKAAIEDTQDQSGPIVVDIGEAVKMLQASPELGAMLMTTLFQSVATEDLATELDRRSAGPRVALREVRSFVTLFTDDTVEPATVVVPDWLEPDEFFAAYDRALKAIDDAMMECGWLPMKDARKDRTPVLLKLKNPIPQPGRDDLRPFDGLQFVGRHPGLAEDGFDIGWNFAAPVGMGGFPDDWFVGWRPLPEDCATPKDAER